MRDKTPKKKKKRKRYIVKNSVDFFKHINLILSKYTEQIYSYNNIAREKGLYLKPVHVVVKKQRDGRKVKYYYYGRYWYKIEIRKGRPSRIKWIYLGKEKPDPELPDPPRNPLEGLVVRVTEDQVVVSTPSKELYDLIGGDQFFTNVKGELSESKSEEKAVN